jgi:hypothetical protein
MHSPPQFRILHIRPRLLARRPRLFVNWLPGASGDSGVSGVSGGGRFRVRMSALRRMEKSDFINRGGMGYSGRNSGVSGVSAAVKHQKHLSAAPPATTYVTTVFANALCCCGPVRVCACAVHPRLTNRRRQGRIEDRAKDYTGDCSRRSGCCQRQRPGRWPRPGRSSDHKPPPARSHRESRP